LVAEAWSEAPEVDPEKRYVRVTRTRGHEFVEFDFAVGDPSLYVELILPYDAFQTFCAHNKVQYLTPEQAAAVDYDRLKWRNGQPGAEF